MPHDHPLLASPQEEGPTKESPVASPCWKVRRSPWRRRTGGVLASGPGITFLRFTEANVRRDMRFVEGGILKWIEEQEADECGSQHTLCSGASAVTVPS